MKKEVKIQIIMAVSIVVALILLKIFPVIAAYMLIIGSVMFFIGLFVTMTNRFVAGLLMGIGGILAFVGFFGWLL